MEIDLNNPNDFSIDSLKKLVASKESTKPTQFRVTKNGILFLSEIVGNKELSNIKFRLETNASGTDYVGKIASQNELWVNRLFKVINENWPIPSASYIDNF